MHFCYKGFCHESQYLVVVIGKVHFSNLNQETHGPERSPEYQRPYTNFLSQLGSYLYTNKSREEFFKRNNAFSLYDTI